MRDACAVNGAPSLITIPLPAPTAPYNHVGLSLTPGTRFGPYEIAALIGAGGMGEVYRATDTNLARQVAVKVLPALVAADPDRLARFDREAKTLAALNHPNIAAIYGLKKSSGITARDGTVGDWVTPGEMVRFPSTKQADPDSTRSVMYALVAAVVIATPAFVASGRLFEVCLNGAKLYDVEDGTFSKAGKVGIWTKADSVTQFDDLTVVTK